MNKQFEEWAEKRSREILRAEHFNKIGKGNDYIFQSLVFTGEASQRLSLATTVLSELKEVPDNLKTELKSIQQQVHDFQEKLRNV